MADVKLLESQKLSDAPDGGGLMTSTEIVDGVVNNLWPDVSRVDRTYSAVNLRKLYCKADTADTVIYSGLHLICLLGPQDPRVNVTLFSTNNWADERDDARAALERYLDESVPTRMIPFDRQLAGQRSVLAFQRPELDLPNIGDVYVLTNAGETQAQFFRIKAIDHAVENFTYSLNGNPVDFQARVITMTITEPLLLTYQGTLPTPFFKYDENTSFIRKTIVADAVSYHTVHSLATDAAVNDVSVKLDSVYTQLIPASTGESAIVDTPPGQTLALTPAAPAAIDYTMPTATSWWQDASETSFLPTPIMPLSIRLSKENNADHVYVDDGAGNLRVDSITGTIYGSVDYAVGSITMSSSLPSGGGPVTGGPAHAQYIPAVAFSKVASTAEQRVTTSTRGYVYNFTLNPLPTPGNLQIAYRALSRWYTLSDDGSGAIGGEVGVGTGSVNYATGTVSVSLGALPDIGSSVIASFGGDSEFEIKTGDTSIGTPQVLGTLPEGNCVPSSVTVTWTANSVTKTATDDGSGNFTGDATGTIGYGGGAFVLKPTLLPDPTTTFAFAYQKSTTHTEAFTPSKSGGSVSITVANAPIREKSVRITYTSTYIGPDGTATTSTRGLYDDGAGNIVGVGTVDYATGVISFNPDFSAYVMVGVYDQQTTQAPARVVDGSYGYYAPANTAGKWLVGYITQFTNIPFVDGTSISVEYKEDSATDTSGTYSIAAPSLQIDLTPLTTNVVVPGGVMFSLAGRTYVDRAGSLYYGINGSTNAGTLGGSLDYATGSATITDWVGGGSNAFGKIALLTQVRALPTTILTGRVPGQALRPASFYIQANQLDGTLVSATADVNGNIDTSAMHGYIDVSTGVFGIAFGQYVLDSSLTSDEKLEPWYDSGNVDGSGYILKPKPVISSSIKYNAVVQTSLPLDPTILGIDPVRLPIDGRVQAVRPGDMAIFHDSLTYTFSGSVSAGDVITLPRTDLARVEVRDQDGFLVLGQTTTGDTVTGALYTADLAAGTITMATPLDLSNRGDSNPYNEPLVATHRIEDSTFVTDVQITGEISFAQPLTHTYTAANSLMSTALIAPTVGGSVQAQYTNLFSQQTWNSAAPNWTDAIVGNPTTPQFDALDYPIEVLNRDAITEKWALVFTSSTTFQVVGQDLGVVGTGSTSTDVSPVNPGTGNPYFVINHLGFGSGWATGNAIRFDTVGAGMPVWLARTINSGPATYTNDRDVIEPRWDKS